jgi:hypothetical protein
LISAALGPRLSTRSVFHPSVDRRMAFLHTKDLFSLAFIDSTVFPRPLSSLRDAILLLNTYQKNKLKQKRRAGTHVPAFTALITSQVVAPPPGPSTRICDLLSLEFDKRPRVGSVSWFRKTEHLLDAGPEARALAPPAHIFEKRAVHCKSSARETSACFPDTNSSWGDSLPRF